MTKIVAVKPLEGFRLWVRFDDSFEGVYDVVPLWRGGVFAQLLVPSVFDSVFINEDFGCVEWPGGVDLCPVSMHEEMVRRSTAISNV